MTDLLDPADPDWVAAQQQSPEYLLRVAGAAIRNHLGWHLSPNIEETVTTKIGSRGIVMLPSRHVTNVESVTVTDPHQGSFVLTEDDYTWNEDGWLELHSDIRSRWHTGVDTVEVTMSHGYEDVPIEVKNIAYELVQTAEVKTPPGGQVTAMSSPGGYSVSFASGGPDSLYLTADQSKRLANYRLLGPG